MKVLSSGICCYAVQWKSFRILELTFTGLHSVGYQKVDLFKNSVHTSHKMQHVSITETILPIQFKEIIAVYSENHIKPINMLCGQNVFLMLKLEVHVGITVLKSVDINIWWETLCTKIHFVLISSVSLAADCGRGGQILILSKGKKFFLYSTVSRLALGPTKSPICQVPKTFSLGVKWL
jgi:hypothetical protein